jgi:hypothetical protein
MLHLPAVVMVVKGRRTAADLIKKGEIYPHPTSVVKTTRLLYLFAMCVFVRWNHQTPTSYLMGTYLLVGFGSPGGLPSRGNKAVSIAKMSIQQRLLKI